MFDPKDFLTTTYNDAVDTTRTPVPVGEYVAQINMEESALAIAQGTSKEGKPWARLDILMTVTDPSGAITAATGRNPCIMRDGIMLDLTVDGKIDMTTGKNIRVGKLLQAAGWEVDDKKRLKPGWSFGFLKGKPIKIRVEHEANPNDASSPYERIAAVTKP